MKMKTLLLGCFLALTITLIAAERPEAKKLTAEEVTKLWLPQQVKTTTDHQTFGGPQGPGLSAYSFRVVGPAFGELWNHYADLCGLKERYAESQFLNSGGSGPKGRYVVLDRMPGAPDGPSGRGLSMFVLKTDSYTMTVTFHPSPDGKSIIGSLTAVTQP